MSAAAATEELKRSAALAALDLVESGTVVGLGTGSTARYLIEALGERLARGAIRDVVAVATSKASEALARSSGVPLVDLPPAGLALAIDGMDEVDSRLRAIKGLGGALTREKIVASSASTFVLIGDAGKRVERLARKAPIPVEVLAFGRERTSRLLEGLGLEPRLRMVEGEPFGSDNGNPVLDCYLTRSARDLDALAGEIKSLPGVVEHGLFLHQANIAFVAGAEGVEEMRRQ